MKTSERIFHIFQRECPYRSWIDCMSPLSETKKCEKESCPNEQHDKFTRRKITDADMKFLKNTLENSNIPLEKIHTIDSIVKKIM